MESLPQAHRDSEGWFMPWGDHLSNTKKLGRNSLNEGRLSNRSTQQQHISARYSSLSQFSHTPSMSDTDSFSRASSQSNAHFKSASSVPSHTSVSSTTHPNQTTSRPNTFNHHHEPVRPIDISNNSRWKRCASDVHILNNLGWGYTGNGVTDVNRLEEQVLAHLAHTEADPRQFINNRDIVEDLVQKIQHVKTCKEKDLARLKAEVKGGPVAYQAVTNEHLSHWPWLGYQPTDFSHHDFNQYNSWLWRWPMNNRRA